MNIVFIDNHTPHDNNGICAYRRIMLKHLTAVPELRLITVLTGCHEVRQISVRNLEQQIQILIPFDLNLRGHISDNDKQTAEILNSHIATSRPTVVHLNWMNHAFFGDYLRRTYGYHILLTKHCVPWRENVVKNPQLFYHLTGVLERRAPMSVMVKEILTEERTLFQLVDHTITVTHDAKDILTGLYDIDEDKVTCIHNGIELDYSPSLSKSEIRKKYGFRNDEHIILFVGGLFVYKGFPEIIKIMDIINRSLPTVRLVVCGKGYFQEFMEMIPVQLKGKITFLGNLPKELLYDFYSLADVGIVPSLEEQLSYVALEMVHLHLPVVITNIQGLSEVLPVDKGLFTPIKFTCDGYEMDHNRAASHLISLLKDPELACRNAEDNYQYCRENFSAVKMVDTTIKVYKALIEPPCSDSHAPSTLPLVSVVIPCHNEEKYIGETLMSVLNQENVDMEIIIVDDHSSDNTMSVVSTFSDPRITVISNPDHLGISTSLNIGISHCKGKYIARMDADDIMMPDRLYRQIRFLEDNPDYDMVGSNILTIDSDGNALAVISFPEDHEEIRWHAILRNPFAHPAVTLRRSVFDKYRYTDNFKYAEDYELWLEILSSHKAYNIQKCLTKYRVTDKANSYVNAKDQHINSLEIVISKLEKQGIGLTDQELKYLAAIKCATPFNYLKKNTSEIRKLLTKLISSYDIEPTSYLIDMCMQALIAKSY